MNTKEQGKHTPVPWMYQRNLEEFEIWPKDGPPITTDLGSGPDAEANAAFIVTAVNAHDALVAAAQAALSHIKSAPAPLASDRIEQLEAALALVGKGAR